jgi:hypothetical protein
VRPRQPKGGPDGGFDLRATFEPASRAVGAIGFRNSPTDGPDDLRWVREKFAQDLEAAKRGAGDFAVFVFLTNVRLTVNQQETLLNLGRSEGSFTVEVFDRERMRLLLDSPSGLAARYQFLQIPLSDAEQAAFFSHWGSDLESLVATSFAATESRLQRLEFLHEKDRLLSTLAVRIALAGPTSISELHHVRAYLSMGKIMAPRGRDQWHIGICNNSPVRNAPNCGSGPCLASAFWLDDPKDTHGTGASIWHDPFLNLYAQGGFGEFSEDPPAAKLSDLDGAFFAFFMNRALFDRMAALYVSANEYLLWHATASELQADAPNEEPNTPWQFSADELEDPWVRVMPDGFTGRIEFAFQTPRRMWDASRVGEDAEA